MANGILDFQPVPGITPLQNVEFNPVQTQPLNNITNTQNFIPLQPQNVDSNLLSNPLTTQPVNNFAPENNFGGIESPSPILGPEQPPIGGPITSPLPIPVAGQPLPGEPIIDPITGLPSIGPAIRPVLDATTPPPTPGSDIDPNTPTPADAPEQPTMFNNTTPLTNRYSYVDEAGIVHETDYFGRDLTEGFRPPELTPEQVAAGLTNVEGTVLGYGETALPTLIQPGEGRRPAFEVGDRVESPVTYNPLDPNENPLIAAAQEKILAGVNGDIPGFETQALVAQDAMARSTSQTRKNALAFIGAGPGLDSGRGQAILRQMEIGILDSVGKFNNQLITDRATLQRGYIDASMSLGKWQEEFKDVQNRFGAAFAEDQFWKETNYYDNRERFGVAMAENQYLADMDFQKWVKDFDESWKYKWSSFKDANTWAQANFGINYSTLVNDTNNMVNNWAFKQGQFEYLKDVDNRDFLVKMDDKQVQDLLTMAQVMGPMLPDNANAALMATVSSVLMGASPSEAIQQFQNLVYDTDTDSATFGQMKEAYKDPSIYEQFAAPLRESLKNIINPETGEIYTKDEMETYISDFFLKEQMLPYKVLEATIKSLEDAAGDNEDKILSVSNTYTFGGTTYNEDNLSDIAQQLMNTPEAIQYTGMTGGLISQKFGIKDMNGFIEAIKRGDFDKYGITKEEKREYVDKPAEVVGKTYEEYAIAPNSTETWEAAKTGDKNAARAIVDSIIETSDSRSLIKDYGSDALDLPPSAITILKNTMADTSMETVYVGKALSTSDEYHFKNGLRPGAIIKWDNKIWYVKSWEENVQDRAFGNLHDKYSLVNLENQSDTTILST